ncbi:hypothetical protein BDZ97DRAFT_1930188 [Flammula alnicola]|nr:hypothetical protein BDZ97DRAFT_1930188 [Flammula alnicola]
MLLTTPTLSSLSPSSSVPKLASLPLPPVPFIKLTDFGLSRRTQGKSIVGNATDVAILRFADFIASAEIARRRWANVFCKDFNSKMKYALQLPRLSPLTPLEWPLVAPLALWGNFTCGCFLLPSGALHKSSCRPALTSSTPTADPRFLSLRTRKIVPRPFKRNGPAKRSGSAANSFDFDQDEGLQQLGIQSLLSRIPEGLEPLRKRFEARMKQAGLSMILKLAGAVGASVDSLDTTAYADAPLEVQKKNSEFANGSFKGVARFAASLDTACRKFSNRNAATGS